MPSFDVVSEIDQQEIRNAVDQAQREVATRYDFKGTGTTIDLSETEIKLHTSSEDRLAALRISAEEIESACERDSLRKRHGPVSRRHRIALRTCLKTSPVRAAVLQ